MNQEVIHPLPVPAGAKKFRVRFPKTVRVYEWLPPPRSVQIETVIQAGEEMAIVALTAVDKQGCRYLRMPWGSDVYLMQTDFEVI